jgi:hypothetical protein
VTDTPEKPPAIPNNPLDPITMQMVLAWIEAEQLAGNFADKKVEDITPIALDAVGRVLGGEVKWSEATAGDRAIWRGRARDVARFDRHWRPRQIVEEEQGGGIAAARERRRRHQSERRYANVYDTVLVVQNADGEVNFSNPWGTNIDSYSSRLFGNTNIGHMRLTNMQIPGGFPSDVSFWIAEAYATATDFDGLVAVANDIVVTLVVGSKPITAMPLREFVHAVPVRLTLPPRQDFYVNLDRYHNRHLSGRRHFDPFELSIHLEGVMSWEASDYSRISRPRRHGRDRAEDYNEELQEPPLDPAEEAPPGGTMQAGEIDPAMFPDVCGQHMPEQGPDVYCSRLNPCPVHP